MTNSYVLHKLKAIWMPFTVKDWQPKFTYNDQGQQVMASPRDDDLALDLYIPLMSFVTFILLVGLAEGFLSDT